MAADLFGNVYDRFGRLTSLRRVGATGYDVQDLSFDPAADTRDAYGKLLEKPAYFLTVMINFRNR